MGVRLFVGVCLMLGVGVVAADEPLTWVSLFDGKTTDGWTPRIQGTSLKAADGELHLVSKKNVWVVSDRVLTNFVFEAEVKMPKGGINSGLGFRLKGKGKPKGYQVEIMDEIPGKNGGLYGIGIGGWIYPGKNQAAEYASRVKDVVKRFEWNHYRIHCVGARIRLYVNGVLITDVEHRTNPSGAFGIQHHGGTAGVMKFRKIRVQDLGS